MKLVHNRVFWLAVVSALLLSTSLGAARPINRIEDKAFPGCDESWSFAVLSDIHIGDAEGKKVRFAVSFFCGLDLL